MTDNRHAVLLVQPPVRDFYFTRKRSFPYGLACMATILEKHGFSVSIIDALASYKTSKKQIPETMSFLEPFYGKKDLSPFSLFNGFSHFGLTFDSIGKKAKESKPFLVGISSLFTAYADEALQTARVIKKYLPDCIIVMGGHHPTHLPEHVLAENAVDYVIRGEGEKVIVELALALSKRQDVSCINGLCYRDSKGCPVIKQPVFIENPGDFPVPALDLVDNAFYGRKNGNSTVITASRGCPMTCSYCCVAGSSSFYRRRSVDDVFDEIERAVKYHGVRFVDFEDENLTLDKNWCIELFSRIVDELGHFNLELRAMNGLYAPSLDDDLVDLMHRAGFTAFNLSLCTLSSSQLKRFRRKDTRIACEKVLAILSERAIESVTYILAGAPCQNPYDTIKDIVYLAGLNTLCGVSLYYPAPGSDDYKFLEKENVLPADFSLMRSSAVPVSGPADRLQCITFLRLGRIVNFVKELLQKGYRVSPTPLDTEKFSEPLDRLENGRTLVESFLYDGRIRGIDKDGYVYDHLVDKELCEQFIELVAAGGNLAIKPVIGYLK